MEKSSSQRRRGTAIDCRLSIGNRRPRPRAGCLLAAALICLVVSPAGRGDTDAHRATEDEAEALLREMAAFFEEAETRLPGSPGNLAIEKKIDTLFAESGLTHGAIKFVAPAFLPGKTTLFVEGRAGIPLLPMHPTVVRPGNFTKRNFSTELVYLGKGAVEDLTAAQGVNLDGAVAVMEFDCGANWLRLLRFGITGFIFIGVEGPYRSRECIEKVHHNEVATARFFLSPRDSATLREILSGETPVQARIEAEPSRWENRMLRDLWVLIPGADQTLQRDVIVITAPMDSNCVVPELATGAQSGANLYLLVRLFEEFRENPPARSVLLAALNAHTQRYLGERMLAWHLLAPRMKLEAVQDVLANEMRVQNVLTEEYRQLDLSPPSSADEEYLIKMRTLMDSSTGKHLSIKAPVVALARRDVNLLKAEQLAVAREEADEAVQKARIDELTGERTKYVNVLKLFNKFGHQTRLSELSDEEVDILRGYVRKIIETNKGWSHLNERDLNIHASNTRIREALGSRSVRLVLCLELVWTGERFGFYSGTDKGRARWADPWGLNAAEIASGLFGEGLFVDCMTKQGGFPEGYYFVDPASATEGFPEGRYFVDPASAIRFFHAAASTPAFAVRNVYSGVGQSFSPSDTFSNLHKGHVARIMNALPVLMRALLKDENLTAPSVLQKPVQQASWFTEVYEGWTVRVKTYKFDEFSASVVPESPVPNSVVVFFGSPETLSSDVMNSYFSLTDTRAACMFYGIRESQVTTGAFHFDPDFVHIDHVLDAGIIETKSRSTIVRDTESTTLALFECNELPIYTRYDTSLIGAWHILTDRYHLLDGKLNSSPKRYGFTGAEEILSPKEVTAKKGPAAFFFERGKRVKLLTNQKRLAINASEGSPEGVGFASAGELGPDFFATVARDMSRFNHSRLGKLRGVSDELAVGFLERGDNALQKMADAGAGRRHVARLRSLYEALGSQCKAYAQIGAITNDMLKAVVFYLALMLPFCFFVEKLTFRFVKIEAEMGVFVVLFVLTFLVFRVIHPAFRIAKAPIAMFTAFVMGALGVFVIKILHGRFEGEMQLLFNTYAGMDAASVGYSTVGQKALLIGVNNMKQRRIRTTLTTATIVLVTFTMLAFTSVSRSLSPTIVRIGEAAPHTGLMYHRPGDKAMDEATTQFFKDVFVGRGEVIVRRWKTALREKEYLVPFYAEGSGGKGVTIEAILGLPKAENGFLAEIPMQAGSFFTCDNADEVILPTALGNALGVTPDNLGEQTLRFNNHELRIVGILDDEQFRSIKDLNNRPLLPVKPIVERGKQADEVIDLSALDQDAFTKTGVFYVDMSALLVMPVETARVFGSRPYSVSVRMPDDTPIWPVIDEILTMTGASKFFVSSRDPFSVGANRGRTKNPGVYYVGEGYRTSIGGLTSLVIPLLIAATIILNTMLGSVFERKNEIAVYNAVGLNPTHIGMFFLAESFVYSIIGSVGGYLIGQVLSIGLTRTGVISEINLNFSSLSVVYVILFTVAVVLLSTIYPSVVATKAAVPSGKRKWALPEHDGQTMNVMFPFIYQPELILGSIGYLEAYFSRFAEEAFGDLTAELDERSTGRDRRGMTTYRLRYNVALAPFDLGVTQHVVFTAAFSETVQAYRIVANIERISGQDTNWETVNKPFLERLRTYLLHWRNLEAAEHALFVKRGRELFAGVI